MAAAKPRDRNPSNKQLTEPSQPKTPSAEPAESRRKSVHQAMDKADKAFYGDQQMFVDLLKKKVLGKVVPGETAARMNTQHMDKGPTELGDLGQTLHRYVDLLWLIWFHDSWLYLLVLVEAQSTVDRWMPLRIMHATALAYQELSKDPEVRKRGVLPPVLPIVVYTGTRPWTAATSVEELLADEAQGFLPYALGQKYVLVPEAEEAKAVTELDTARDAALWLRYAEDPEKYEAALAKLKELLPEGSPTRDAVVAWVRGRLTAKGVKEEHVERLRELEDLESPIIETIWDKDYRAEAREQGLAEGREEGRAEGQAEGRREGEVLQQAMLVRQARRKFGAETAERLAALLEGGSNRERAEQVADLVIDCASGRDLLKQLERLAHADPVETSD